MQISLKYFINNLIKPGNVNVEPDCAEGFNPKFARLVVSPAKESTNTCDDPSIGLWCCDEARIIAEGGADGFIRDDATLDIYKLVQFVIICKITSESSCEIVL